MLTEDITLAHRCPSDTDQITNLCCKETSPKVPKDGPEWSVRPTHPPRLGTSSPSSLPVLFRLIKTVIQSLRHRLSCVFVDAPALSDTTITASVLLINLGLC